MQYVRPGAGTSSAPTSGQAGGTPPAALGGRGTGGGSNWGQGRGGSLKRGEWGGGGRSSYGAQRGSQSGPASWGSAGSRGFPNGIEFNLPPTK